MAKSTKELKELIAQGGLNERLADIYVDEALVPYHQKRYIAAIENFEKLFGEQEVEIYSAPGRSEVGGNHTDHQRGKVMATSLNLDFIAVVQPTSDEIITFKSDKYPILTLSVGELEINKKEYGTTNALVRGVAAGLKQAGFEIGGFRAFITSDVLSGSGMSSSAALEILIGTILSGLYNDMKADPVFLAQVGQYAENIYFGKPCGLMDQMACSVGGLVYIDFEDVETPVVKPVSIDFKEFGHSLCISDTKGSHANLTDDYAAIPVEMKKIAEYYGAEVLRQVDPAKFYQDIAVLRKKCGDRAVLRAMHLFEENDRVDSLKAALEAHDFETFRSLITASGNSSFKYLQNVFATHQVQEQGLSIGLAVSERVLDGTGAVRVHGGGFAGTIQAFVPDDKVEEYRAAIDGVFGEGSCHVLKVRKYGGIKVC
ncbi:MAG: galactokinase family protein [Lachnospiraceae bacterium]|nr:galactokinase family protein [Lachnospiraceae bacterium]